MRAIIRISDEDEVWDILVELMDDQVSHTGPLAATKLSWREYHGWHARRQILYEAIAYQHGWTMERLEESLTQRLQEKYEREHGTDR